MKDQQESRPYGWGFKAVRNTSSPHQEPQVARKTRWLYCIDMMLMLIVNFQPDGRDSGHWAVPHPQRKALLRTCSTNVPGASFGILKKRYTKLGIPFSSFWI